MPHLYKLTLSYDGTTYFGWQKTKMGPSIQESLQKAIKQITQEEILPESASRTDRGVHAIGQVVSVSLQKEWKEASLQKALNAALPQDIRIHCLKLVPSDFHPTLLAKKKEYHYRLCLGEAQDPIHRLYSWAFPYSLDVTAMKQSAQELLGTHDFSAFANAEPNSLSSETKHRPFCTLEHIDLSPLPENRLQIAIVGDRFLYKMARNIAGTLIYIGCGKLPKTSIAHLLASRDRKTAGITAPAHGLFLYEVVY